MSSEKFVEVHKDYRVPKEEYEAHMARMAQEAKAEKRSDMMTSAEEDAWEAAETIRQNINNLS